MTATAFKHDGSPIIYFEGCTGATVSGLICRTATGPFNAVGLKLKSSTGVTINGSEISDCATAIVLDPTSACELVINTTKLLNYTNSVTGNGAAADVTSSAFNAANTVDIRYNDNTKNVVQETKVFNIACTFTELNAGGKNIILPVTASERWRVMDIIIFNSTSFDAGGDRNIQVLDAVAPVTFTTMTAANLKAAPAVNRWGSAVVPFPATGDLSTPTTANHALVVKYSGGTTNYSAGVLNITVTAMRDA